AILGAQAVAQAGGLFVIVGGDGGGQLAAEPAPAAGVRAGAEMPRPLARMALGPVQPVQDRRQVVPEMLVVVRAAEPAAAAEFAEADLAMRALRAGRNRGGRGSRRDHRLGRDRLVVLQVVGRVLEAQVGFLHVLVFVDVDDANDRPVVAALA